MFHIKQCDLFLSSSTTLVSYHDIPVPTLFKTELG